MQNKDSKIQSHLDLHKRTLHHKTFKCFVHHKAFKCLLIAYVRRKLYSNYPKTNMCQMCQKA